MAIHAIMPEGGRLVVPAELRRQLGMAPGTKIIIDIVDGSLRLRTQEQAIKDIQDDVRRAVPPGVSLVDELIAERRADALKEEMGVRAVATSVVVLDASALLAVIKQEPGQENVQPHMRHAVISAVNLSEVGARMVDHGGDPARVIALLRALNLDVRDVDVDQAYAACALRPTTRSRGLSLGDRAWSGLDRVQLIR